MEDTQTIRVLGIDPSTSHMGVSVLEVNLFKPAKFKLVYVNTIHGDNVSYFPTPPNADDGVLARVFGLCRALKSIINVYEPTAVICEDNFRGPNTGTFKTLIETVSRLRETIHTYYPHIQLDLVLPNPTKAVVNANFKGTTKVDVQKGIMKYKNLDVGDYDILSLDDHSTDAIVISLYLAEAIAACNVRG